MKTSRSRKQGWPQEITVGRVSVTIYKRTMPNGKPGFLVANYSGVKRRLDSYAKEADALEAAGRLARQLSERDTKAATMTEAQAVEYVSAVTRLKLFNVTVDSATATVVEALRIIGGFENLDKVKEAAERGQPLPDLASLVPAAKFYKERNKVITAKRVSDVVEELAKVKEARNASARYLSDLRGRLDKFADAFQRNACDIRTEDIQTWLDGLKSAKGVKMANASYAHYRQILRLFFSFAVARGYAIDNPVAGVEKVKVKRGATQIFSPVEIQRLLAVADAKFLPALAIGAFAGLRSAEVERLAWEDIDLARRHIVLNAEKSKTAARRLIPISDNLAAWLADYAESKGKVWRGGWLYKAQQDCAAATRVEADDEKGIKVQAPVKWKQNALRHSYASYRLAQTQNAAQVALECGNSAQMIFQHYREVVTSGDAQRWFNVKPDAPANVLPMNAVAVARDS